MDSLLQFIFPNHSYRVMIGGRVSQKELDYIPLRLARVQMLMNECMEVLTPYFDDNELELTPAQELIIEGHSILIDDLMKKITNKRRALAKHTKLYTVTKTIEDSYFELYKLLYDGYNFWDRDVGMEELLRKFHHTLSASMNAL